MNINKTTFDFIIFFKYIYYNYYGNWLMKIKKSICNCFFFRISRLYKKKKKTLY